MDRDETVGGVKLFRDFARALAAAGIASLRFDKVTFTYRNPPGRPFAKMTLEEEAIGDVRTALAWLRAGGEVDPARLALVAHGTGATVAATVASDGALAALVLIAAPAEAPDRALLRQY